MQPADLVSAIRTVDGGDALLHPAVAARVLRELTADGSRRSAADSLTSREHEVLALIARGRANKAIALDLACAPKTSRPTSATSSPSSVCRTARRRRCTRCARAWRDRRLTNAAGAGARSDIVDRCRIDILCARRCHARADCGILSPFRL